ncbi:MULTISPECIES: TetR/AcrR family transcriptional regulator [Geobacter]|uniref:TetR/AcrR family transcriptional regulator n=1 Tax=Geobacter TaxID=28231 RepID=UPI002B29ABF7|nr:TetR/AcrR family transcriptional regulator [Geobacter sulfurreducens]BET59089.1 TetR/AcrR family transcriptional regulator [Geobacter sp. 60473]HML79298.1 TetR/AcrR family transcriptional regulator [Geobacter sulfurreducens]
MPPKGKDPQKTRELILTTALGLFADRGYFATSVHDIRHAAGLSIGCLYHHFDGKEAIARAIYDDLLAQMTDVVETAAASQPTVKDRCRAIVAALFSLAETDPLTAHFVLHARHREFLPEAPPICSTRPFEIMRQLIVDGIDSGEIRPLDPTVASAVLFGGAIRLLHLALDGVLPQPIDTYLDEVMDAGWRGITA